MKIRIDIPVFFARVYVVMGTPKDAAKLIRSLSHDPDVVVPETDVLDAGCFQHRGYPPVIWVPEYPNRCTSVGSLAHEAVHAATFILDEIGHIHEAKNDEVLAYVVGYIVSQALLRGHPARTKGAKKAKKPTPQKRRNL